MQVRNEADILPFTLRHLERNGIQVLAMDDGSTDGSKEILTNAIGNCVLRVFSIPKDFVEPDANVVFLQGESKEYAPDWLMCVDADEAMFTDVEGETLKAGLERVHSKGFRHIQFSNFDFVISDSDDMNIVNPLERMHFVTEIQRNSNLRAWSVASGHVFEAHKNPADPKQTYPRRWFFNHYPYRTPEHAQSKIRDRMSRLRKDGRGGHYQIHLRDKTYLAANCRASDIRRFSYDALNKMANGEMRL